jgi:hypothetical protein
MTERKLAANRANARRSRGAATQAGKARAAAANLRHGYYSPSAEAALAALGEDPAEFQRRLESLRATWQPVNALEESLVMRLARALWRMERFDRIQESLAVKHLERVQEARKYREACVCLPLIERMERLKALFGTVCMDEEGSVGPQELQLFEQAYGSVTQGKAKEILPLLLRLRKADMAEAPDPSGMALAEAGEIPVAQGPERKALREELVQLLVPEIESLQRRILKPEEETDEARARFARDEILAGVGPAATLMTRGEESNLRQVWRLTNLLMRIKKVAGKTKDVKNADCSQYVIENKGARY